MVNTTPSKPKAKTKPKKKVKAKVKVKAGAKVVRKDSIPKAPTTRHVPSNGIVFRIKRKKR